MPEKNWRRSKEFGISEKIIENLMIERIQWCVASAGLFSFSLKNRDMKLKGVCYNQNNIVEIISTDASRSNALLCIDL